MAIDFDHPRWRSVVPYFRMLPISEKRCFFARALKFMLDPRHWDKDLRPPVEDDHKNMREMLLAFNEHTRDMMYARHSHDVQLQWQSIRQLRRGKKIRTRKRQISRLTYEYMQLIRRCHPAGSAGGKKHRNRARCMPGLQREVKDRFLSRKRRRPRAETA